MTKDASETRPEVIALDGPAGVGKSVLARRLARDLGWTCLDTGALYRALTLAALEAGVDCDDAPGLVDLARALDLQVDRAGRVTVGGRDVTERIRRADVTEGVAHVAALPGVRRVFVELQRRIARHAGHLVAEGRDMGTVVFPDAVAKVFLDAHPDARARRRLHQEAAPGEAEDPARIAAVRQGIEARDLLDRSRRASPLAPARDAWRLDTTGMTLDEVFAAVRSHVRSRIRSAGRGEDPPGGGPRGSGDEGRHRAGPGAAPSP